MSEKPERSLRELLAEAAANCDDAAIHAWIEALTANAPDAPTAQQKAEEAAKRLARAGS